MGFQKWIIKNGPGSVGDSAKFFSKYYNRIHAANPGDTWHDIFLTMYADRVMTNARLDPENKRGGSLSTISMERIDKIINSTQGDLPLFIYLVTKMEEPKFGIAYFESERSHRLAIEVIREVVSSLAPLMIVFANDELLMKAHQISADNFI